MKDRRARRRCVLALFVTVASCPPTMAVQYAKKSAPIRIAVFTATAATDQFAGPEEHQRRDSVKDLESQLRLRKNIKIVSQDEQPDLLVEVLGRERKADGGAVATATPFFGGALARSAPTKKAVVRVRLSVVGREYSVEIVGSGGPWRAAARGAAQIIETWVKDNWDRLRPAGGKK
jgi:hypothetical protein